MAWVVLVLIIATVSNAGQFPGAFHASWFESHTDVQAQLVTDHKIARSTQAVPAATNMKNLVWDPLLAKVAQTWLDTNCTSSKNFNHNPDRTDWYCQQGGTNAGDCSDGAYVGENWYGGNATATLDFPFNGSVAGWTNSECSGFRWTQASGGPKIYTCTSFQCSEADNFYGQHISTQESACSGVTGHFTQVMWANTGFVGCGYTAACGTLCDYAPGGNFGIPTICDINSCVVNTPLVWNPTALPLPTIKITGTEVVVGDRTYRATSQNLPFKLGPGTRTGTIALAYNTSGKWVKFQTVPLSASKGTFIIAGHESTFSGPMFVKVHYSGDSEYGAFDKVYSRFFFTLPTTGAFFVSDSKAKRPALVTYYDPTLSSSQTTGWSVANGIGGSGATFGGWSQHNGVAMVCSQTIPIVNTATSKLVGRYIGVWTVSQIVSGGTPTLNIAVLDTTNQPAQPPLKGKVIVKLCTPSPGRRLLR